MIARGFLALLATAAMLAASAAPSWAAEEEHHAPSWSLTLLAMVNFAIFVAILYRLAWPLMRDYLRERRERVVTELEAAARTRAEAEAMKADIERRMQSLEAETLSAREEILALARRDAEKIVAQAQVTAERIRRDAALVADQEVARARRELQQESAATVARIAGELISREITAKDQDALVSDFLGRVKEMSR